MSQSARKIRVLVVDDSVVMRRLLAEVIASDPGLEVAGYAANGQIALALLDNVAPDVVTLDIEMPVLNGLDTLKAIRSSRPTLPVIMFSTLTERGAEATIDSLALGASDYVAKPVGVDYQASRERIREALLPRIKALCRSPIMSRKLEDKPGLRRPRGIKLPAAVSLVLIGSSTGGPNALAQILPAFPADFPVPVLIVQHMPPAFTRFLAERLNTLCKMPVEEARDGAGVEGSKIWIAAGGRHLGVSNQAGQLTLRLTDDAPENSCRPSVDVLFRSAAQVCRGGVLAVILTGMGQDGLRGCRQLAGVGAEIVAQDEATSVVWGMPGFVAGAGLADAVLPLAEIAPYILRRVASGRCCGQARNSAAAAVSQ